VNATTTVAEPLLDVRGLTVGFPTRSGLLLAAHDVSFSIRTGRTLGLVGESGCGKSVTLRALLGLVPYPGAILSGAVGWLGRDLRTASEKELRDVRGAEISMVFQDPSSSLNPVFSIGDQLGETLRVRLGMRRREARARAVELLERVGIPSARRRLASYPHQLSGGMRQRVMIALAIASRPKLLLADEPTTALDVTIQEQILVLLRDVQAETGMAIVLVSHDLGVIAEACDEVSVMYAGRLLEQGPAGAVLRWAMHPYTRGLVAAVPPLHPAGANGAVPIAGQPPNLLELPPGCPFAPRCPYATEACAAVPMTLEGPTPHHRSACPFVGQEAR